MSQRVQKLLNNCRVSVLQISISCQVMVYVSWMLFKKQPGVSKSCWHLTNFGPNWWSAWKEQSCYFGFGFETDHKCSHPKTAGFYLTALSNRNTSVTAEPRSQTETILCSRHCTETKVQIASRGKGEGWRGSAIGKTRAHAWSAEALKALTAFP